MKIYVGLVHHPIKNKKGEKVTTSVTNLDIHDISRSCRTFGVERYFIVTPLPAQQELVGRILGHWEKDVSNDYNPDRHDALSKTVVIDSVEKIRKEIGDHCLAVTGANFGEHQGSIRRLVEQCKIDNKPILLLFGTGWGLHQEVLDQADYFVEPIYGFAKDGYNHLSVRSAVAIYLSQLQES